MLQRHKIPTVFNIYMLDVICCALGCVILLWQVAHKEAESQTEQAKKRADEAELARKQHEQSDERLQGLIKDVAALRAALQEEQQKQAYLSQSLASTEKDRDAARLLALDRQNIVDKTLTALNLSRSELGKLEAILKEAMAKHAKLTVDLASKEKSSTELLARYLLMEKAFESLKKENAANLTAVSAAQKKSEEQAAALKSAQADVVRVQKQVDAASKEIAALKKERDAFATGLIAAQKRLQDETAIAKISQSDASKLQKLLDSITEESRSAQKKLKITELSLQISEETLDRTRKEMALIVTTRDNLQRALLGANSTVSSLQIDKDRLSKRVAVLESDLDQRFAGIPLTGENVIFLIDVSGSMMMKDPDVADPDKWPFLCDTLMKLMKSIPTLQRFQIILFSDKTTHLFGNRDHWLKYDGASSARQARDALLQAKVDGGTNMHDGFDEAFRYRKIKLDTIYLFSDGLPNIGPGVPSTIVRPTETQKNLHMAKFLRDKLKSEWNGFDAKSPQVRLNAVGFYFESPDVGAFLWALAREHKGNFVGLR